MKKKKLLVCGSTGFIGRNVTEFLLKQEKYDVYGTYFRSPPLGINGLISVHADLTRAEDVKRAVKGMDIIVQAAATTSGAGDVVTRPYIHVTDNAVMNSHIFRAAHEQALEHIVFFSCTVMYPSREAPLKESDFDANRELHKNYFGVGWTKVYLEKMCEFYSRIGGTKYTAIRHSNVYGPHDKFDLERSHVCGATVTKVMSAPEGGEITVWGDGETARDLLYITDLVDFVDLALERQVSKFELFNAGYGEAATVTELVKKIIEISGKNIKISYDKSKPSIKTRLCLDSSRAKAVLGWSPKVSLDVGLQKTIDWFKTNATN